MDIQTKARNETGNSLAEWLQNCNFWVLHIFAKQAIFLYFSDKIYKTGK
jgi:hypothetical protein